MLYNREMLGTSIMISKEPTLTNPYPSDQKSHVEVNDIFHVQFYKDSGERFFSKTAWTLKGAESIIAAVYKREIFKIPTWPNGWPSMHVTVDDWPPKPKTPKFTENELKVVECLVRRLGEIATYYRSAVVAASFGEDPGEEVAAKYQNLFYELAMLVSGLPENLSKEVKLRHGVDGNGKLLKPWAK